MNGYPRLRPDSWRRSFEGIAATITIFAVAACTAGPNTHVSAPMAPPPPSESSTSQLPTTIGTDGIGDPYFPTAGNGGYQVDSYDINVEYDPSSNKLRATARLVATVEAAERLEQFNLDLQPTLQVTAAVIDGTSAEFTQHEAELVMRPREPLDPGTRFTLTVEYAGMPTTAGTDQGGWFRTPSGGALVFGEPVSASTWFPANEHPSDPATFAATVTIPQGWRAIGPGLDRSDETAEAPAGWSRFRWVLDVPVATYVSTIYIDKFMIVRGELKEGVPMLSAIGPDASEISPDAVNRTRTAIDVLSGLLGTYPMPAAGGIFVGPLNGVSTALETATRPIYAGEVTRQNTIVHEVAHQWFGNHVSIESWADICLSECLASYSEWLYAEEKDAVSLDKRWRAELVDADDQAGFWESPPADPGPRALLTSVYTRGPLALHALRREMGDRAFFNLIRRWLETYGGHTASFDDFEALANQVAKKDLSSFIDAWFRDTKRPASAYLRPGALQE